MEERTKENGARILGTEVEKKNSRKRKYKREPYLGRHRLVDWTPPNVILRSRLPDNSLVKRRATCLGS